MNMRSAISFFNHAYQYINTYINRYSIRGRYVKSPLCLKRYDMKAYIGLEKSFMDSYFHFLMALPVTKRQRFSVGSQLKGPQISSSTKLVGLAVCCRLVFGRHVVRISAGTFIHLFVVPLILLAIGHRI